MDLMLRNSVKDEVAKLKSVAQNSSNNLLFAEGEENM